METEWPRTLATTFLLSVFKVSARQKQAQSPKSRHQARAPLWKDFAIGRDLSQRDFEQDANDPFGSYSGFRPRSNASITITTYLRGNRKARRMSPRQMGPGREDVLSERMRLEEGNGFGYKGQA